MSSAWYPLGMTNIAMEAMAHRNRWFTVLNSMVIFHGELLNNQIVIVTNIMCQLAPALIP